MQDTQQQESGDDPLRPSPYILPAAPHGLRSSRHALPVRHSVIHTRGHRGLQLVAHARPARTRTRRFWSGWLDQKHLDRGFLFLAVSSALLLLLSAR